MRLYIPTPNSPFKRFNSSPEVIRLVVMMYVRFPLSLRNVEDQLFERGIDISYETVEPLWAPVCSRCTPAACVARTRHPTLAVLESCVTKSRDKKAALAFMRKALKRHGSLEAITTDGLRS